MSKSGRATERTSQSSVLHLDDAHVLDTSNGSVADCAGRDLDLDGEVSGLDARETKADAADILCDLCWLEGACVCAARGGVDGCGEGAGAILVDLVEVEGDGVVIRDGRETRVFALTGSRGYDAFCCSVGWGFGSGSGGASG